MFMYKKGRYQVVNNFQLFYERLLRLTRSPEPPLCLFLSRERLRGRRSRDRSRPSFLSRSPRDRSRRSLSPDFSRLSLDRSLFCEWLLHCLDRLRSRLVPFLAGGSGDFFLLSSLLELSSSSLSESFLFAFLCFFFSFFSFFFFFFFFSSLRDRTASSSSSSSELPGSLTENKKMLFTS